MTRTKKWLLALGVAATICLATYLAFPFFVRPPFNVPKAARWVRCSEFAYWLAYDLQVKFSAPYEDCIKAAEDILAKHRAEAKVYQPDYVRVEIRGGCYLAPKREDATRFVADDLLQGSKWWFRPGSIKNGVFLGERGPYVPQIWIDKDRGLFYYKETD
jgi:hypothetical protein